MSRQLLPDCFLSFAEVAEIIGLDESTIRNGACGTDELLRIKLGKRTLFSFNDIQTWIAQRIERARAERQRAETEAANIARNKAETFRRKQFMKDTVFRLVK